MINFLQLLLVILSVEVSASSLPAGCEVLLQTSFGRVLRIVAQHRLITLEELREIEESDQPVDPWRGRQRDEKNLSLMEAFAKYVNRPQTRAQWPRIREAAALILKSDAKEQTAVQEAQVETAKVINPLLMATLPYGSPGKAEFQFNPARESLVLWNMFSKGGEIMSYELKRNKPKTTMHTYPMTGTIRRDGKVWVAGATKSGQVTVSVWPSGKAHIEMEDFPSVHEARLYEMPSGQMLLSLSSSDFGVRIFDVTKKGEPRSVLLELGRSHSAAVFHVTAKGEVFVAVPLYERTVVYKMVKGTWSEYGSTLVNHNPVRYINMASDSKGNLYLGESLPTPEYFRVVKFVDGNAEEIFTTHDRIIGDRRFLLYTNAKDELILVTAFSNTPNQLELINLSREGWPRVKVPMAADLMSEPQMFKLPNNVEVLAVCVEQNDALIVNTDDGSVIGRVGAIGEYDNPPAWTKLSDGRILLAVESGMREIRVYDIWRPDGAQP